MADKNFEYGAQQLRLRWGRLESAGQCNRVREDMFYQSTNKGYLHKDSLEASEIVRVEPHVTSQRGKHFYHIIECPHNTSTLRLVSVFHPPPERHNTRTFSGKDLLTGVDAWHADEYWHDIYRINVTGLWGVSTFDLAEEGDTTGVGWAALEA